MKFIQLTVILTVSLLLIAFPVFGKNPHPLEDPLINFQGRVEENDVGYTGNCSFRFYIGTLNMATTYWDSGNISTSATEGIFNVLIGESGTFLSQTVFQHTDDVYYLRVAFSTDGTNFETLSPDQQIVSVPFAVNADLLDGLESPSSAFVGLTDVQTMTNKTLTDPTLTRPVIDSTYFLLTPGSLPANPSEGYIGYDSTTHSVKYRDNTGWVDWGSGGSEFWTRTGTTLSPKTAEDDVSLGTNENLIYTWNGSPTNLLIALDDATKAGIYQAGNSQIDFVTQSERRFSIRSGGQVRYIPVTQPGTGEEGDFYYDTDQHSFMYYYSGWHPIASGTGSIMNPFGPNCTLRGSDGTTWVATTGMEIDTEGTVTVAKNLHCDGKFWVRKNDTDTYIASGGANIFDFYTNGNRALTIDDTGRFNVRTGGSEELPAFAVGSDIDSGIHRPGDNILAFSTGGTTRFKVRSGGEVNFAPLTGPPTVGSRERGDFYFDTGVDSFMYYSAGWHPIASGTGAIMNPIGTNCTLRGSDGTTWVATTGLLISTDGTCTVQKNIIIKEKMHFYDDQTMYIQGPAQDTLDIYTNNVRALTIDNTGRLNVRMGDSEQLPAFTIGSDIDTGIHRPGDDTLAFSTGGETKFKIRAGGQVHFAPRTEAPTIGAAELGDFYFDTGNDSFMYYSGGWKPIASGTGSIEEPDAVYDTVFATDGSTWWPNKELRIQPGSWVKTDGNLEVGGSGTGNLYFHDHSTTYITESGPNMLEFYTAGTQRLSLAANGDMVFNDTSGQADARFEGDDDEYLLYLDGGQSAFAVGTSNVTGYKATFQQTANKGCVLINQDFTGDGLTIAQDGAGNALEIAQNDDVWGIKLNKTVASANYGALFIDQDADTRNDDPTNTYGGALHISNTGNLRSGLTIYSSPDSTQTQPLVHFKVDGSNFEQPVVKITGSSTNANHLWLYPQVGAGATTNEGELYASSTTHALMYYNGTDWIALTGAGGEGGSPGGSDTYVQFNDGGSFGGDSTFTFHSVTKLLTVTQITTSGANITAFSTDTTLSGNSDNTLPTEKAVKEYVDERVSSAGGVGGTGSDEQVAYWTGTTTISGDNGFKYADDTDTLTITTVSPNTINAFILGGTLTGGANIISGTAFDIDGGTIDDITSLTVANAVDIGNWGLTAQSLTADGLAANRVVITAAGGALAVDDDLQFDGTDTLTATKITTGTGATITEFSTDTTLVGGDVKVPTELAVKTYVDDAILDGTGAFASGTGDDTHIAYWVSETTIDGEGAFIYNDSTDKVTITSGATDGEALEIKANSLTSGTALKVSSTADGTYDLVTFTSQTGKALVISRKSNGRALEIDIDNTSLSGVWIASDNITTGRVLTVKANSDAMTGSGYALYAIQDHASASGHALVAQQDGTGNAVRAIVTANASGGANAIFINQGSNSDSNITQSEGGALHIDNTGNNYGGLTVFSGQTSPQIAPLTTIKTTSTDFDQALLSIDPAVAGNAPHLYLKPITGPVPQTVADGMIYMDTDGYLKYYNGTWISLTGAGAGGVLPDATDTYILRGNGTNWVAIDDITTDGAGAVTVGGSLTVATADINGGTIDDVTINSSSIGVATAAAAEFTTMTAEIMALSGSGVGWAGGHVITWENDPDTGFYRVGADELGIYTGGSSAVLVNADNELIVNTTDQGAYKLQVDGTSWLNGNITAGGDVIMAEDKWIGIGGSDERIAFDGTGGQIEIMGADVGIGTAAPGAKLEIEQGAANEAILVDQNGADEGILIEQDGLGDALNIDHDAIGAANSIDINHASTLTDSAVKIVNVAAAEAIYVDQNGNTNSDVSALIGGAIHVNNSGNTGSAITAFAVQEAAVAPLVWLNVEDSTSYEQPVLRIDADSGDSPHLFLNPIANEPTFDTEGSLYANTDGKLYYQNGAGWAQLNSRWSHQTTASRVSTSTFTVSAQGVFIKGRPIRSRVTAGSGAWLYGVVVNYATGTVTIDGAPLPATIGEIQSGDPEMVRQVNFYEPGDLSDGDDFGAPNAWQMQEAYVVRATAKLGTAATGQAAHISFGIGAETDELMDSPDYIVLGIGVTTEVDSAVNIDTAEYKVNFGEEFFVNVEQKGNDAVGADLLVTLTIITP